MKLKTSKNLVSALKGSSFRRVVFDARTLFLRKIKTLGAMMRNPVCH